MARFSPLNWPVVRQLTTPDRFGRGEAVTSRQTRDLKPRTATADRVVQSVCPYCAVGCGQLVYVKDDKVIDIEGDPDSPISRGRLCPKGSASEQLVNSPGRQVTVLEEGPSLGRELSIVRRWRVLDSLRQHKAELLTQATVTEIGSKAVTYTTQDGETRSLPADSVVLAIGARPDDRLARELESVRVPVITAGDGAAIGYIEGALASGFAAGNRV